MKLIKTNETINTAGKDIPVLRAILDEQKGLYLQKEPDVNVGGILSIYDVDLSSKLPQ